MALPLASQAEDTPSCVSQYNSRAGLTSRFGDVHSASAAATEAGPSSLDVQLGLSIAGSLGGCVELRIADTILLSPASYTCMRSSQSGTSALGEQASFYVVPSAHQSLAMHMYMVQHGSKARELPGRIQAAGLVKNLSEAQAACKARMQLQTAPSVAAAAACQPPARAAAAADMRMHMILRRASANSPHDLC